MKVRRQTIGLGQLAPKLTIVVLCEHDKTLATLRLVNRVTTWGGAMRAWDADLLENGKSDRRVRVLRIELVGHDEMPRTMERLAYRQFDPPEPRRHSCKCTITFN